MKKAAVIPALALLLVTGCSAEAAGAGAPSASAPANAPVSADAGPQDSEAQTCLKLLGTNGNGPLYNAIYLVKLGDGTSGFGGTAETAGELHEELGGIARSAPQDIAVSLEELSSPMENTMLLAENSGSPWNLNVQTWKGAVADLLTRCAPHETGTGGAASFAAPAPAPADGISTAYPGYPLVVNAASLDYRVAAWFAGRLVDGRVVALAPGLYAPYDPNVPDLLTYYVPGAVAGDTARKQTVFPGSGVAASWTGVRPGTQEPQ